jgi:tRNA nucleotidyltransferase (CCA-adding enzyme)
MSNRFAFELSEDICCAAKDEELRQALLTKVSRERVGIETEGMLSGKSARSASHQLRWVAYLWS